MIYLFNLLLIITSCEEETKSDPTLQGELIGTWIEISPCDSCNTIVFREDGVFTQKFKSHSETLDGFYEIIGPESIKVTRNWVIESEKKTTVHELIFHADDTLEIEQFMPVDVGVTGFSDISLRKIK